MTRVDNNSSLTWIETMAQEAQDGKYLKSRIRAVALPVFAACQAVEYVCMSFGIAVAACFKMSFGAVLLSLPRESEQVKIDLAEIATWYGIAEFIKTAFKAAFCVSAIFCKSSKSYGR